MKININIFCIFIFSLVTFIINTRETFSQPSGRVSSVSVSEARENQPLTVSAELIQTSGLAKIILAYRSFGQSEYKQREMILSGASAKAIIPASDVVQPYIEYYLILEFENGKMETYPFGVPQQSNALQVSVTANNSIGADKGILILSPEEGGQIEKGQLFVSISLLKAPSNIDRAASKIFIDNADFSSHIIITEDLILLYPEQFSKSIGNGNHSLTIELYDSSSSLIYKRTTTFEVIEPNTNFPLAEVNGVRYGVSVQYEARNESFDTVNTMYNRGLINFNASYNDWKINGQLYLTNEEHYYLQPQDRYSLSIESSWLQLNLGDTYPSYPSLIMNGKRVRGVSGSVTLGDFNLQTSYGQITRSIEGQIIQIYQPDNAPVGPDVIPYMDSLRAEISPGSYSRNIFAIRPSYGNGKNFQFGVSYLHSVDDKNSAQFAVDPQENVVLGSDLMLGFDDRNILFTAQAALSISNDDITTGTFSNSQIDSLFGPGKPLGGSAGDIKLLTRLLSRFITVNQFLKPIELNNLSTFASEAALDLNYFDNNFTVRYLYRGNDFQSFGQSYLQTDVQGFNFLDRVRFLENRLFVTMGFENLNDNLQKTKFSTTDYQTINFAATYYPQLNLPHFNIGYSRYYNYNDLSTSDPDSVKRSLAVNDITNRYSAQIGYDFNMVIKQHADVSFIYSKRNDNSIYNYNAENTSVILSVSSEWNNSLNTSLSASVNQSNTGYSVFNYTSVTAAGSYLLLSNQLEMSAFINPNFGSLKRIVFDAHLRYNLIKNLSFMLEMQYFKNFEMIPNDSMVSFVTRYAI